MDEQEQMAPSVQGGAGLLKELREPTVTDGLQFRREKLAQELETVDAALAALKANPEIERVLNLIQRASKSARY